MRIILVGADIEENLGMGMIAAVAEAAGHTVSVVPFNEGSHRQEVVRAILSESPEVVGLSMQFQHRAREFLALAKGLRSEGFSGHITAGGHFPTLAFEEVLSSQSGLSSVVLHEGEESFVELLRALASARPLGDVPGLALLDEQGRVVRTRERRLVDDLDRFPFPKRYRPHSPQVGIPFIPIMGGRGCWGRCSYCSIMSVYRDARRRGGGKLLRLRSPENVAAEMAELWRNAGGRAIFCFHDDNFLLPRPEDSWERLSAIRQALDRHGVGEVGFVGKCRPDALTPQLAQRLKTLGVVRLFVGIENTSEPGLLHLGRGVRSEQSRQALAACKQAGIFVCYNLLMFEPQATLDHIEDNIAFVREHVDHPFNFGRAEPYFGTPLHTSLAARGNLTGSYLGHGYRITCDRTELLFRICAAAFRQRNYDPDGVHNRFMGVGCTARMLDHFYGSVHSAKLAELTADARRLTRAMVLESADFLEEALALAREADLSDRDHIERHSALLALRICEADRWQHALLDRFFRETNRFVECSGQRGRARPGAGRSGRVARLARRLALGTLIAAGVQGCGDDRTTGEDGADFFPDALDYDAIFDAGPLGDAGLDVVDPDVGPLDDASPDVILDLDPDVPPLDDAGLDVVDPDVGPLDDATPAGPDDASNGAQASTQGPGGSWRDTAPQHVARSSDLPLFDPPAIKLSATRGEQGSIRVCLSGGPRAMSFRWEGDGQIEGQGREVVWRPDCETDQIRVGVRSSGGIAVAALRARDVPS